MRRAYSSHAACAHSGSLALTARTCSLGTSGLFLLRRLLGWGRRGVLLHPDRLTAPHLLEVVELPHRRMHDVHHHVAEIDEHPFARALALDAIDLQAALLDLLLHALRKRFHLAVGIATRDHHALEHRGHARRVVDLDVLALDILQGLDDYALFLADVHLS